MTQLVVDRKALLESMDNDAEFLKTVIGIFLADCPGMMAEIRLAVTARDPTRVMSASHALKGSVSFFVAKSAVEAARTLESMGKEEKLEGINEALCVLEREIALVLCTLEAIGKEAA
jgi:HPt (histidine-containing phosphotransfer) domain-containing protein